MISVIVAIFNVEDFLPKCLASLASQTFPDVEIILVDDGSTDQSGSIADAYNDDPRFCILHTRNRGLSAARNLGIEQSHGEWLMFVDGDDWVEPSFCQLPYEAALKYNADFVIFQSCSDRPGKVKKNSKKEFDPGVISASLAFEEHGTTAWNKLYKRELFNEIRYPEGMVYEDIATTYKLIYAAKRIVVIPDNLYHYVVRKGSITHTRSLKNKIDAFTACSQRCDFLFEKGLSSKKYEDMLLDAAIALIASEYPKNNPLYKRAMDIVNSSKVTSRRLPWKKKVMLILWRWCKPVFYLVCFMTGRMKT